MSIFSQQEDKIVGSCSNLVRFLSLKKSLAKFSVSFESNRDKLEIRTERSERAREVLESLGIKVALDESEIAQKEESGPFVDRSRALESDYAFSSEHPYVEKHRPYQAVPCGLIAEQLASGEQDLSVLICDDMGTGKSLQAIMAICETRAFPCVVLCPAPIKRQWADQIKIWTAIPDEEVFIAYSLKASQGEFISFLGVEPKFVIINYELLGRRDSEWPEALENFQNRSVIFDEVQNLNNSSSNTHSAIGRVFREETKVRILLTGTPLENSPADFSPLLQIARRPILASFASSLDKRKTLVCSASNRKLSRLLRSSNFYLRRTPEDLGGQIPKMLEIVQMFANNSPVEYTRLQKSLLSGINPQHRNFTSKVLNALQKLRMWSSKKKTELLPDWIFENIFNFGHEKVLILYYFIDPSKQLSKLLRERGVRVFVIGGGMKEEAKEKVIKAFRQSKVTSVLFLSIGVSTGVNGLQHCTRFGIFSDLLWNPAKMAQAAGRLPRLGGDTSRKVFMYYPVLSGTVDEVLLRTLTAKRINNGETLSGKRDSNILVEGSKTSLLEVFDSLQAKKLF